MQNFLLSIIIPSFNDANIIEKNIPQLIDYMKLKDISYEIIVVDDGSKNSLYTEEIALKHGCRFLFNSRNLGKGAAVRKGMLSAQGKFCLYTDVDIPFYFESIDLFLRYLDFKEFDVVIGDRTLPESEYFKKISFLRNIGSNVFSFIAGRFVAGGLFDTQCGLKGFRHEIAFDLFSHGRINGFAFDIELLYIALKRNYDIKRLPVRLRSNEGSSVKLFRHGTRMFFDLLHIRWNQLIGKYKSKQPPL